MPPMGAVGAALDAIRRPAIEGGSRGTVCPACGSDTGIPRSGGAGLGSLSLDELETLVAAEWRWRRGPAARARSAPAGLIRALATWILIPESRLISRRVERMIWKEVDCPGAHGRSRSAVRRELEELLRALTYVLVTKGRVDPGDALRSAAWLRGRLDGLLVWPE